MGQRATLWTAIAVLGVHNLVGNLWLPQWAYLPANLFTGTVIVWLAMGSGISADDLAGPRPWLRRGAPAGLIAAACGAAVILLLALLPSRGSLFGDARVLGVGTVGVFYRAAIRIPIGTALFEEVAFRGVLPALGRRVTSPRRANLLSAVLFGCWHLIPATAFATGNESATHFVEWLVILSAAVATAAIGLGLSAMRDRWGLVAPIVFHAAVNSTAFVVAWSMV